MASKDYDKMTVALLRDELKSRNLSLEGKKAELIERLRAADKDAEDELLNSSLGDDLNLPVNDEDLLLQTGGGGGGGSTHIKIDASDLLEMGKESEKAKKRVERISSTEAKMTRAARFGLPISAAAGTHSAGSIGDDAKANRAKRFGLTSDQVVDSKDAKAKRLARFGAASIEPTPAMNATKLGNVDEATKERLLKRAQRFGLPVSGSGKAVDVGSAEEVGKKRARMERFGLPV